MDDRHEIVIKINKVMDDKKREFMCLKSVDRSTGDFCTTVNCHRVFLPFLSPRKCRKPQKRDTVTGYREKYMKKFEKHKCNY